MTFLKITTNILKFYTVSGMFTFSNTGGCIEMVLIFKTFFDGNHFHLNASWHLFVLARNTVTFHTCDYM